MASTASKSPNNMASTQDFAEASPKSRVASGTLPPQAAQAPEFIPGEAYQLAFLEQLDDDQEGDRKTSDVSSDREQNAEKKKRSRRHRKRPKIEEEADEEALKQKAMDEEWWSGDDVFVPDLQDRENVFLSDN